MPLHESTIQNQIRELSGHFGDYMWRNNNGAFFDPITSRPVRFGLANESKKLNDVVKSSDLIGPTRIFITPEMVGTMVAVFTAVEVKEQGWKYNPKDEHQVAQKAFHDLILGLGGYAGFAQSVEDYRRIVKK